jgi:glycosyltransferase involved in cell wall biosynthesis
MVMRVLTNWADDGLIRVLHKYGIHMIFIKENMPLNIDFKYVDLIYYASPVPPLINKDVIVTLRSFENIIYGLHMPLTIDNPVKPSHVVYDLIFPLQTLLAYLKGASIHVLNLRDYKLLRIFGLKSIYVPLGTDTELFRCRFDKPSTFTMVYASRPSWHKGTDLLVNYIIPIIHKKLGQDSRIVITDATSDYLSSLYDRIRGIRGIELYDHLPIKDYARLLSEAHVLLFPSRYESFGRVVLDSLASGVIPVAFRVRGVVEDVLLKTELNRYVVNYPDLSSFINKVIELYRLWYKCPDEYYALVKLSCKIANQYSWEIIGKMWVELFKQVLLR